MARGNKKRRGRFLVPSALGFAAAFFFDPDKGAGRRNMAKDRMGSIFGRFGGRSQGIAKYTTSKAQGIASTARARYRPDNPNPDDLTLRDRVESEIFRDPAVPKGDLNINVIDGVVEVRGELEDQQRIDDLIERVRSVPNVQGVHSYLHLPGTPAPNKEEAMRA